MGPKTESHKDNVSGLAVVLISHFQAKTVFVYQVCRFSSWTMFLGGNFLLSNPGCPPALSDMHASAAQPDLLCTSLAHAGTPWA